ARFLVSVTFEGLEQHLFEDDRKADPRHAFNDPRYTGASVLVVNANFGCGSSREHAPQGLVRHGIRAMIGMPCFVTNRRSVERLQDLIEKQPETVVTTDVATGAIAAGPLALTATL